VRFGGAATTLRYKRRFAKGLAMKVLITVALTLVFAVIGSRDGWSPGPADLRAPLNTSSRYKPVTKLGVRNTPRKSAPVVIPNGQPKLRLPPPSNRLK
jgi:hypothetical protein